MPPLCMNEETAPIQLWGGVECTTNRVGDLYVRQLRRNHHWDHLEDLDRIAKLGIRTLRYPLLWEELAPEEGRGVDWSWADRRMERLSELGIRPIVGLLHHGSGPRHTSLVDSSFPEQLAEYARAVAERYPWVDAWTPVNEPLTTARFSGLYGHWYPHGRDVATFCRALMTQLRGVVLAMREIRQVNPKAMLVQTEDLGVTTASPSLQYQADFENERRWLTFDLLTGTLTRDGVVARHLRQGGVTERELETFQEENCPPDILGINHYITSSRYLDADFNAYPESEWGGNGRDVYVDREAVRVRPEGFCEPLPLLEEVCKRYGRAVAITEAHLGCTREEQIRWFAEIWKAAVNAKQKGVPIQAVTAWSLLGAYDWDSLLTEEKGSYEPGAWDLRSPKPRETALARVYEELARTGEFCSPVLGPGWWRRRVRALGAAAKAVAAPDAQIQKAFVPRLAHEGEVDRILITGARSALGRCFARACHLRGLPYRLMDPAEMYSRDIGSVRAALREFRPWAVVDAASFGCAAGATRKKFAHGESPGDGAAALAIGCRETGARLLTFSSDMVFDGTKESPYVESDAPQPLTDFGKGKAIAEMEVLRANGNVLMVRTGPLFDAADAESYVVATLDQLRSGKVIKAMNDCWFSPTYAPDLVRAALDLLIDGEWGIWHLANTGEITWAELAKEIARRAGLDVALVAEYSGSSFHLPLRRPRYLALASERGTLLPPLGRALGECLSAMGVSSPSSISERIDLRPECAA